MHLCEDNMLGHWLNVAPKGQQSDMVLQRRMNMWLDCSQMLQWAWQLLLVFKICRCMLIML